MMRRKPCPCGGLVRATCCQPILVGRCKAATAEALMRARYSAFVAHHRAFLRASAKGQAALAQTEDPIDPLIQWQKLTILSVEHGEAHESKGWVTFAAHYTHPRGDGILQERSEFAKIDGEWFYVSGQVRE